MNLTELCIISLYKGFEKIKFYEQFELLPHIIQKQLYDLVECLENGDLPFACEQGYLSAVRYFVKEGADIHAKDDEALRWAAWKGHLGVVKYLVERGANVHAEDIDSNDALRLAAENGHLDVVKYLKKL